MMEPRLKKLEATLACQKIFCVQHSHRKRGERDEQDKRKHDARESDREVRLSGANPAPEHG